MPVSEEVLQRRFDDVDHRLLLLDAADNVFVIRQRLRAGEPLRVGGVDVLLPGDIPIGHKVARHSIEAGDKIMKYGAPIGTATTQIAVGAHVHVHNLQSDYTPTYHLLDAAALKS